MKKILTGSTLKLLAVVFMLIDHFGQIVLKNGIVLHAPRSAFSDAQFSVLLSVTEVCHILGRIAFPIFCFLLVEGFQHTHNLKKYVFHLGVFALVSEPIYDLAAAGNIISMGQQNVLFTLLLGLVTLTIIRKCSNNILITVGVTAGSALISYLCDFDGWYYGILLIVIFYIFYDKPAPKYILAVVVMYLCGMDFTLKGLMNPSFLTAAFSLLLISFYNGKRGMSLKYFFYIFYPAHLLLLFLISTYLIIPLF